MFHKALHWQQISQLKRDRLLDMSALLGGALLPLAFAPFKFYVLAVISPLILLACWQNTSPKRCFWRGWLFGLGQFGVGVSWVYISIHVYGNTIAPLAAFLTLGFVAFLGLFPALQGYLFAKLFAKAHWSKIYLGFPLSWALMEWVRSWVLTGFPWLLIGYSQVASPLAGWIPIVGAYGLAFMLAFSASAMYAYLQQFSRLRYAIPMFFVLLLWLGSGLLLSVHWTQPLGKPLQVSLIQGNVPQELKWDPKQIRKTLRRYTQLTAQHWDSDLIVWPEAAITLPLPQAKPFVAKLKRAAKQHYTALITGIPIQKGKSFHYYNAVIVLGEGSGKYYKRHLVPFGEYVPLENYLRGIIAFLDLPMSTMVSGPKKQADLMAEGIKIAPFICYEVAYANDLYNELPQAKLLVTVSNDAWFGDSLAPPQHLQMGQFRALQAGRYMLFATNNGITAIINNYGEVAQQIPAFQRAVLTGSAQPFQGATPWVEIGNWPFIFGFFVLLGIAVGLNRWWG